MMRELAERKERKEKKLMQEELGRINFLLFEFNFS
jgi:hypothetical protein